MSAIWLQNLRHVVSGEPVASEAVNRTDRALAERDEYLKQRLDTAALGQAIFDLSARIAPDVEEGMPVFWNATDQRYEKALAAVESDENLGTLVIQASADCLGLCYKKNSATTADIVTKGLVQLPGLSNAVDGSVEAGRYYLSSEEAGKLVKQRPPVTVSICYVLGPKDNCSDSPWVLVSPQVRDFLEDHIHYRFELVSRPAGVHDPLEAASNEFHEITEPDAELQGWLPADHEIFNDKAPAGAKFGYNLSQHPGLAAVWPPMPLQAVAMLRDKGINDVGATELPIGSGGLVVCDANGIWWMTDCYDQVPWPTDLDTTGVSESSSESISEEIDTDCPHVERMRVIVVFLRMVFGNDRSVVTSLKPAEGSPITVTNCDGLPGTTGDLQLGIDLDMTIVPPLVDGSLVFKELGESLQFKQGRVIEGVVVTDESNPITVIGSHTRPVDPEDEAAGTIHQGLISITFNDELVEREISPQITRLNDAVERVYKDILYLGFPIGQVSSIRSRFVVPSTGLATPLVMKIRTQLFGRGSQVVPTLLPEMTMTYRIIPRPATPDDTKPEILIGATFPVADTAPVGFYDAEVAVLPDTPIEVESDTFAINAGDTVLVTLQRDVDAYAGEVGLLRMVGVISTYTP